MVAIATGANIDSYALACLMASLINFTCKNERVKIKRGIA